jgi:hypothetical protein
MTMSIVILWCDSNSVVQIIARLLLPTTTIILFSLPSPQLSTEEAVFKGLGLFPYAKTTLVYIRVMIAAFTSVNSFAQNYDVCLRLYTIYKV